MMIKTGFLPSGLTSPEQVIFVIMKGKEMGMGPMQALQHIEVIQGKLCIKPEGMLAQVLKFHPAAGIEFLQNDDKICQIRATKGSISNTFQFTIEDAAKAGLSGKDNWKKYTRAMLRSRCIGEMCRSMFPEAIQGMSYTVDEIKDMQETMPSQGIITSHAFNTDAAIDMKKLGVSPKLNPVTPPVEKTSTPTLRQLFQEIGVTEEDLAEFIGKPLSALTSEDKKVLDDLYKAMQKGEILKEDMMEFAMRQGSSLVPAEVID